MNVLRDKSKYRYRAAGMVARGLGWFSIGLGVAELLVPRMIARATGLRGHETLIRCYGVREIATGIGILTRARSGAMDLGACRRRRARPRDARRAAACQPCRCCRPAQRSSRWPASVRSMQPARDHSSRRPHRCRTTTAIAAACRVRSSRCVVSHAPISRRRPRIERRRRCGRICTEHLSDRSKLSSAAQARDARARE